PLSHRRRFGYGEMVMKCPSCGKEETENHFFCGWCNASLRESAHSTVSPEKYERLTQMVSLIQNRFLRICVMISGILLFISGVGFAIFGAYAIAKGDTLTYMINDRVVRAGEFAEVTLMIGLALVFAGFFLRYVYHKEKPARAE
ncbi:MAG: hypothetical protein WBC49_02350, partial [Thermoplasmata archaeon]